MGGGLRSQRFSTDPALGLVAEARSFLERHDLVCST
jgi:hypothetical protein